MERSLAFVLFRTYLVTEGVMFMLKFCVGGVLKAVLSIPC